MSFFKPYHDPLFDPNPSPQAGGAPHDADLVEESKQRLCIWRGQAGSALNQLDGFQGVVVAQNSLDVVLAHSSHQGCLQHPAPPGLNKSNSSP